MVSRVQASPETSGDLAGIGDVWSEEASEGTEGVAVGTEDVAVVCPESSCRTEATRSRVASLDCDCLKEVGVISLFFLFLVPFSNKMILAQTALRMVMDFRQSFHDLMLDLGDELSSLQIASLYDFKTRALSSCQVTDRHSI